MGKKNQNGTVVGMHNKAQNSHLMAAIKYSFEEETS